MKGEVVGTCMELTIKKRWDEIAHKYMPYAVRTYEEEDRAGTIQLQRAKG